MLSALAGRTSTRVAWYIENETLRTEKVTGYYYISPQLLLTFV